jgi:nitrogen fixation/metabolism regulation signal transduction histidine kinase
MTFRRFTIGLAIRLVLIGAAMAVVIWLIQNGGYRVGSMIIGAVLLALIVELWAYVRRTNREVSRFLAAARNADFSQRFAYKSFGSGFDELGREFTDIINRLRERGIGHETEVRKLRALIEHIPVPLLTLHADETITLQNNAARRLFGAEHVTTLRDLRRFGVGFADSVANAIPAERVLVEFSVEGIDYQLALAATEIVFAGKSHRLISLQDIQSELDTAQAEAWQDLVSVLTHEIINSIAPVTSLAASAADVVDVVIERIKEGKPVDEELDDLQAAVSIVANRSGSLTQFVDSYRQITRLAPAERKRFQIRELFNDVSRLALAECPEGHNISLNVDTTPAELDLYADRDLVEPVLLNLLRNARQATTEEDAPKISLTARLNRRGNTVIEVSDNGHGVSAENARKIFVPFFTTREDGSGVGLALARQVMIAHGGFIRVGDNKGGGAVFQLTF